MTSLINISGWILLCLFIFGGIGFIVTSCIELKRRAALLAVVVFIPSLLLWYLLLIWNSPFATGILGALIGLFLITTIIMLLPIGSGKSLQIPGPQKRIDEREAIFHRFFRLKPGMKEFDTFYKEHPEFREIDDAIRAMPSLDEFGSESYSPHTTPYNAALFDVMDSLFRGVDQEEFYPDAAKVIAPPEEFTTRIKGFSQYLGADLVGITKVNPAYVYTHIGRSPGEWGSAITCDHPHAIVLAVEMDYKMVRSGPHHITTTESSYKYYKVGQAALAVSRYIQMLGYRSRAHIDGNYRVLCGPLAQDAGLGELGRLGLLITPEYGPRVRLAVVTTDMPLIFDKRINFGVQDFCEFCKKCATNCPSGAIEKKGKSIVNGVEKWQSSQEECFKYWHRVGSDCSICLKVCPYSHPGTMLHNVMRFFLKRNSLARRAALIMDDFFYGRRPKGVFPFPEWHSPE